MSTITDFTELDCWKLSRKLAKDIFEAYSNHHEFRRDFALRDQIRRSSGSSMDNIAEGFGRGNNKEFVNFLGYAVGSCDEVRSQLFRAFDSGYLTIEQHDKLQQQTKYVGNKIHNLIAYLNKTKIRGYRYFVSEESEPYKKLHSESPDALSFPWDSSTDDTPHNTIGNP